MRFTGLALALLAFIYIVTLDSDVMILIRDGATLVANKTAGFQIPNLTTIATAANETIQNESPGGFL